MAARRPNENRPEWAAWGRVVEEHRRAAGLTRKQIAKRVGIDDRTVCYVEMGRHRPNLSTVRDLCGVPELQLAPPPVYFRERELLYAFRVPLDELQAAPELLTVLLRSGFAGELGRAAKALAQHEPDMGAQAQQLIARLTLRNGVLRPGRPRLRSAPAGAQ